MQDTSSHIQTDDTESFEKSAFTLAGQGTLELVDLMTAAERLSKSGRKDKAADLYRLWLDNSTSPLAFVAWFNLGTTLFACQNYAEAESMYRKALDLNPDLLQARLNLGTSLEQQKKEDEALEEWRIAIESKNIEKPENEPYQRHALNNLGRLLETKREFLSALEMLEKSFAIDPTQRDVLIHLVHLTQKICKWPIYNPPEGSTKLDMLKYTSPLAMLAVSDDPDLQLSAAKHFVEYKFPVSNPEVLAPKEGYRHEKIRIGYLSSDFCLHAVSLLTVELLELHDRDKFEVYGFCWSREGGTVFQKRVVKAFDHYLKIGSMSDREAADCIRSHEIDIIIDLQGLTSGARPLILSYRPAVLQMTYLGFPGTTGLPWIDYVIADKYLIPDELVPYHTEKPLYMPNCFQSSDTKREVGPMPTRADNGLPEKAFVFCSFNNNYKFIPEVFAAWMRILKRVPGSVFWLLADNEWAKENLLKEAKILGVNKDRLIFAPRVAPADYLARYQLADLFLDTFPFNGGTTANDALFMGLPLLTLSGRTFASRMAGSLLTNLGLSELIATNLKEYEEKAVRFAKKPAELKMLQGRLKENKASGSVFDMPNFTKNFEKALAVVLRSEQYSYVPGESEQPQLTNRNNPAKQSKFTPFFSIIITTHDRPDLLARSLASVRNQTFKNYEILVISDSLNQKTYSIAGEYLGAQDIFIKRTGVPGPAQSRNIGLENASGQYIIFLDDDDSFGRSYLENLYYECEKNPGVVLYCNFHVVKEDRQSIEVRFLSEEQFNLNGYPLSQMFVKNFIPNNAIVFPRFCIGNRRFDTHLKLNEDWEFLLNIAEEHEFQFVNITGPKIHKDEPSKLTHRGSQNQRFIVIDMIYIYSKWPGTTQEIKLQRQQLMQNGGIVVPIEWV